MEPSLGLHSSEELAAQAYGKVQVDMATVPKLLGAGTLAHFGSNLKSADVYTGARHQELLKSRL